MAVKEAEKPKEGTKPADAAEAEKEAAAKELLDELKAEEAAEELSAEDKAKKEKEEAEAKAKADGTKPEGEGEGAGASEGSGSQPDGTAPKKKGKSGFQRRQSRLVTQRDEARGQLSDADKKIQALEDKLKVTELRNQQLETKPQEIAAPNPDDFDDGVDDQRFIEQKKKFDDAEIDKRLDKKLADINQSRSAELTKQQQANALKEKQQKHWDASEEMGSPDYREKEEAVIDLLGVDKVNMIIDNYPGDSHKLVYFLGVDANAEVANEINDLLSDRNTYVRAVTKIGGILANMEKNPNFTISPDPDTQSEGSAPSHRESLQMQLDKMRDSLSKNNNSGGLKKILAFKKKAKERGITLR